jgi:tRNA (adenine57-N1/adenine58-N1)-methyltransferase
VTLECERELAALFRDEFERHGMSEFVTLQHRNVCKEGFGLQDAVDSGM